MSDKMFIRDLKLLCTIGTRPEEREKKQELMVNIMLTCDLAEAGRSDSLDDAINYAKLTEKIVKLAETSSFFLIERMAEAIAGICLEDSRVFKATVIVDKPMALAEAGSAAVKITRKRDKPVS